MVSLFQELAAPDRDESADAAPDERRNKQGENGGGDRPGEKREASP
jgi:hypothetical protein